MGSAESTTCAQHGLTRALVEESLPPEQRRRQQRHLEHCRACREWFHEQTGARWPALPNYTILEQVGKGGFGVVYKAIHHTKERTEAVKVLFSRTDLLTGYFQNEVHLIARLRHPNIATLYEAHLDEPPLYYAMDFVEGQRLNEYLKTHEVSLAQRIEIVRAVVQAVGYAHEQGVVHRDLKPQNILMDAAGVPHIVDFGIAKRLDVEPGSGEPAQPSPEGPVGTLGYIAPEQVSGKPVDARCDIFSLGALLFHAVTGEPARYARQPEQVQALLRQRGLAHAEDLAAIISRCLDPDPGRRYPSCQELARDLTNYLEERPVEALPYVPLRRQAARVATLVLRRHALAVNAALLTAAVVLLTLMLSAWEASRVVPGAPPGERTVVVALNANTAQNLAKLGLTSELEGFDPLARPRSWRLVHGRLMEKLAAVGPRIVVWDYHFPECEPEFDPAFVKGLEALRARHIPVIVGAALFDVNGEPALCPQIRQAVQACGSLASVDPRTAPGEFELPYCILPGFGPPIPGLAVAAFAAFRFPDCEPDLSVRDGQLEVRYRKRHARAGEPRWQRQVDRSPIHRILDELDHPFFRPGDRAAQLRFPARPGSALPTLPYEDVFSRSIEELTHWCQGRAVVVGQMLGLTDRYDTRIGEPLYGCQIQAQALDALLSRGGYAVPLTRHDLALRCVLGCAAAAALIWVLPLRRGWGNRFVLLAGGSALAIVLGLAGTVLTAAYVRSGWLDLLIPGCALLVGGGLVALTTGIRHREVLKTPQTLSPAAAADTQPSTVLAEPQ